MRAVFVSYCHPQAPHICAVRLRAFAEVLARQGHQIVLLTSNLSGVDKVKTVEEVQRELQIHNWDSPYYLPCPPISDALLWTLRRNQLPGIIRKALTAWYFLVKGGVFSDWTESSRRYWEVLSRSFKPEVVWATFGNTDALLIAQAIARLSEIPWVMDMKDVWEAFVPKLISGILVSRFKDVAGITYNSETTKNLDIWISNLRITVYSGFHKETEKSLLQGRDEIFRILLIGSIYSSNNLKTFFTALEAWLNSINKEERKKIEFIYAGGNWEEVQTAAISLSDLCNLKIEKYIEHDQLYEFMRNSNVNAYMAHGQFFHHKIIELLACNKPILCYPADNQESTQIVKSVQGNMYSCSDTDKIVDSLNSIWEQRNNEALPQIDQEALASFSWEMQAKSLIDVFLKSIAKHKIKEQLDG